MGENRYVENGFASGLAGGLVLAGATLYQLHHLEEGELGRQLLEAGVPQGLAGTLASWLLNSPLAPLLILVSSVLLLGILGVLAGWLHEYLDKRLQRLPPSATGLLAGLVLLVLLVAPNLAMGASRGKVVANTLGAVAYTVVLVVLSAARSPRAVRGGDGPRY